MSGKRFQKLTSLERGWSGNKMPGRSIGPPDPIGEDVFEGFDTRVLELKTVFNMKGNLGRKRRLSAFVVTGNENGLAGFSTAKAVDSKAVLRKAKNRAGQKLIHIDLCDGHGKNRYAASMMTSFITSDALFFRNFPRFLLSFRKN